MTDPYKAGLVSPDPFHKKQDVQGSLVAVLSIRYEKRGAKLMPQRSRAVLKNEIHELMLTDESVSPNDTVDRISCLGFFEVDIPGMIVMGDDFYVSNRVIGTVAGFNDDHMPNHLNVVICGKEPKTGAQFGFDLRETVLFQKKTR